MYLSTVCISKYTILYMFCMQLQSRLDKGVIHKPCRPLLKKKLNFFRGEVQNVHVWQLWGGGSKITSKMATRFMNDPKCFFFVVGSGTWNSSFFWKDEFSYWELAEGDVELWKIIKYTAKESLVKFLLNSFIRLFRLSDNPVFRYRPITIVWLVTWEY